MKDKFDPIIFLEIEDLEIDDIGLLRRILYEDMAMYLIDRFTKDLPESLVEEVKGRIDSIENFEDLEKLINQYQPNFEEKKIEYLNDYKYSFNLRKFLDERSG